jgi:hypothetical protein
VKHQRPKLLFGEDISDCPHLFMYGALTMPSL